MKTISCLLSFVYLTCARVYWERYSRIQFKVIPIKRVPGGRAHSVVGGFGFSSVPAGGLWCGEIQFWMVLLLHYVAV